MNLKEQLAGKVEIIGDLKLAVEGGDEQAADELAEAIEEAKGIQGRIEAAEEAEGILKSLGGMSAKSPEPEGERARTIGEHAAKAVAESGWKRGEKRIVRASEYKAATDIHVVPASAGPLVTDIDRDFVMPYQRPTVLDLFAQETISGSALTYYVYDGTMEGAYETVAEGAKKPQIHFADPEPVTATLHKIAGYYKESDELVEDIPRLAAVINEQALYRHELAREDQVLNGDGTGTNILGLLNRNGIQTGTYTDADSIFDAMTKIANATGFQADAIVINPADYQTLRLAKDGNQQYYGGGYFYGQYGTNGMVEQPPIWGVRTVVTPAVPTGTVVVGAFRLGASLVTKAGSGVSVEVYNQNEDDAIHNLITIVVESRLELAVRYPLAFAKLEA